MSSPFDKQKRPKVGVGVIVTSKDHPGCILIGRRKGTAPGEGQYALPGGHLEFGETWEACAMRETKEECGLHLTNVVFSTVANGIDLANDYHYLELYMTGEVDISYKAEPENCEPEKCDGWLWISWDALPPKSELFLPLRLLKEQGFIPRSILS